MEPPIENGITVNFGSMEFGSGTVQPKEKLQPQKNETPEITEQITEQVPEKAEEPTIEPVTPVKEVEKVLTQDNEDSILDKTTGRSQTQGGRGGQKGQRRS